METFCYFNEQTLFQTIVKNLAYNNYDKDKLCQSKNRLDAIKQQM